MGIGALAKLAPGSAGGIAREMESNALLADSSRALRIIRPTAAEQSYALALGRLDTSSCQRVKYASFGAIFMSETAADIDCHQRRDVGDCEAVPVARDMPIQRANDW